MSPDYPIEIEQWWVDQARAVSGVRDLAVCLDAFRPAAARLSDAFTIERPAPPDGYAEDETLLTAYALLFFPQTFVRTRLVLSELTAYRGLPAPIQSSPLRILDLGAGLGGSSFAALCHFAEVRPDTGVELRAADRSGAGLARLRRLFDERRRLWPRARLTTAVADLARPGRKDERAWDLVLVSFALNEVAPAMDELDLQAWVQGLLAALRPGGALVIIEPAGEATSPRLQQLRDWIAEKRVAPVLGPCLHEAPCPMLKRGHGWCHEVRKWRVPESVEYLNRKLQRTLQDLKYSFLALGGAGTVPGEPGPDDFRMVAPMKRVAGRLITTGCGADGELRKIETLTRSLPRAAMRDLLAFERGSIVRPVSPQTLRDGKTVRAAGLERMSPGQD